MRTGGRRVLSLIAISAIALHAILWGVAPLSAVPTLDPFSVICHSETQAVSPGDQSPADPGSAPAHACDHCNLCSTTAVPVALDSVLASRLAPLHLLHVLIPTVALRDGLADDPNRARGPPTLA